MRKFVLAVVVVVVAAGGIGIFEHFDSTETHGVASGSTVQPGDAGGFQNPVTDSAAAPSTKLTATRVRIPSIGVDTKLIALDLKPGTDQLKAPLDFGVAGWYSDGTVPGDVGPAVIDGHVDSPTTPGVFLHLAQLREGDQILVTLSNSTVKSFLVTRTIAAPKDHFPTDAVYGPTPDPQLRLITCDGVFNRATGHYLDNLVVFAALAA